MFSIPSYNLFWQRAICWEPATLVLGICVMTSIDSTGNGKRETKDVSLGNEHEMAGDLGLLRGALVGDHVCINIGNIGNKIQEKGPGHGRLCVLWIAGLDFYFNSTYFAFQYLSLGGDYLQTIWYGYYNKDCVVNVSHISEPSLKATPA